MTDGAMFGVVSAMMKYVVNGDEKVIEVCKKILEELEYRKDIK